MKRTVWLSLAVLGLGIGCLVAGAARGEVKILFEKAINICLECIGIG